MSLQLPLFEELVTAHEDCDVCQTDPYADGLCFWCWFAVERPRMLAAERAFSERLQRISEGRHYEVTV